MALDLAPVGKDSEALKPNVDPNGTRYRLFFRDDILFACEDNKPLIVRSFYRACLYRSFNLAVELDLYRADLREVGFVVDYPETGLRAADGNEKILERLSSLLRTS